MTKDRSTGRSIASPDLGDAARSFGRHLRASNLSPRTVQSYLESVALLGRFLVDRGLPSTLDAIGNEEVEAFQEDLLSRHKATTAMNRHAGLRAFFRWAVEEGEIAASPMTTVRRPKQVEHLPPVLAVTQLEAVLGACRGDGFTERRDAALVRLFVGTGARLAEVAGLRVEDVDLDAGTVRVMGKGRRERVVYMGTKAIKAMDRYQRVRGRHREAGSDAWWLGRHGPMTASGISQMLKDRGVAAGVPGLHAHQFRHYYAHTMLSKNVQEGDLMALAGWRSREMLARYAAATRADRANAAARRLNPGDEL